MVACFHSSSCVCRCRPGGSWAQGVQSVLHEAVHRGPVCSGGGRTGAEQGEDHTAAEAEGWWNDPAGRSRPLMDGMGTSGWINDEDKWKQAGSDPREVFICVRAVSSLKAAVWPLTRPHCVLMETQFRLFGLFNDSSISMSQNHQPPLLCLTAGGRSLLLLAFLRSFIQKEI